MSTLMLPTVEPVDARILSELAGQGRSLRVRLGNEVWTLEFVAELAAFSADIRLPLKLSDEPALMEVHLHPGGNWAAKFTEFQELKGISDHFASAVNAVLCKELIDAIEAATESRAEVNTSALPVLPHAICFRVKSAAGSLEARTRLSLTSRSAAAFLDLAPSWVSAASGLSADFRIPVAIGAAVVDLLASELDSLRLGDCVVLGDGTTFPAQTWIQVADLAPVAVSTVLPLPEPSPLQGRDDPSAAQSSNPMNASPVSPLAESIRLPALMVVARRSMTLSEIEALHNGASIEIGEGDPKVEIQIHQKVVAVGRLTRVGDKVCVEVTEIRRGS